MVLEPRRAEDARPRGASTSLGHLFVLLIGTTALTGCFGQPEDQFTVGGTAFGADGGVWPFAKVKIERDQGASKDGCSAFADFTSVVADESGAWTLEVIRQQTRGRLSDHRCFRATISHPDGRRSAVVFPFTGDDVRVPPLRLWPDRQRVGPSGAIGMFVQTLPDSFRLPGEGASALIYRAELDNGHGRVWRTGCTGNAGQVFCDVTPRQRLGTLSAPMRAAALQTSERYGRDPFGQLKVTVFDQRIESRAVTVGGFAQPPFTLGADCDVRNAAGSCVLTDGDARPHALPFGTFQVELDFGVPILVGPFMNLELYVHGIWVDGPWTRLVVEAQLQDTEEFVQVGLFSVDKDDRARVQVSREDPAPALDLGPILVKDTDNSRVLGYRKLRLHAVNDTQTVPMVSLGEVAVY